MNRRRFAASLAALASAPVALVGWRDRTDVELPMGATAARIPNVWVTSHDNQRHRFYDDLIKGRLVLINFMYADCEGICPLATSNLKKVQEALGDRVGRDIFMYSFTLKPEEDTVGKLHEYAEMHGIKPGWRFLRASKEDTDLVRARLGFVDSQPEIEEDIEEHTGMVRIGHDAIDRWTACPSGLPARELVRAVLSVDPNGRPARG